MSVSQFKSCSRLTVHVQPGRSPQEIEPSTNEHHPHWNLSHHLTRSRENTQGTHGKRLCGIEVSSRCVAQGKGKEVLSGGGVRGKRRVPTSPHMKGGGAGQGKSHGIKICSFCSWRVGEGRAIKICYRVGGKSIRSSFLRADIFPSG